MQVDLGDQVRCAFVAPRYEGPSLATLLPAIFGALGMVDQPPPPAWLQELVGMPERMVLLVLDGLGYAQLLQHANELPTLGELRVIPGSSCAPTTTASALTTLTTGAPPARHGVLGYRMLVGGGGVLNVLRWTMTGRGIPPAPERVAPLPPFLGANPVAVTKAAYQETAFTRVHLRGARLAWWSTMSQLVTRVSEALGRGERFVYAYYEGIDTTAHEFGLDEAYLRELRMVDRMVEMLLGYLPAGVRLVITADHGQVDVGPEAGIALDPAVLGSCSLISGEGRFRWLHTTGDVAELAEQCRERYGEVARVLTRSEAIAEGLYGGDVPEVFAERLGSVALVATGPVWFEDPADQGALRMRARHGALSGQEVLVPIMAGP